MRNNALRPDLIRPQLIVFYTISPIFVPPLDMNPGRFINLYSTYMRNIFSLLLLAVAMLNFNIPALSKDSEKESGEIRIVIMDKGAPKPGHTHRSPSIIPFDASYDPILNQVVVSYNSTVESTVSLSNLMTGENSTTYGTTSLVILPVPSDGTYLLEITLANGREYYGTFDAVSE